MTTQMIAARIRLAWAWVRREAGRITQWLDCGKWLVWFLASSMVVGFSMLFSLPFGIRGMLDVLLCAVGGFAIGGGVFAVVFRPHDTTDDFEESYERARLRFEAAIPSDQDTRRRWALVLRSGLFCAFEEFAAGLGLFWSIFVANRIAAVIWLFLGPIVLFFAAIAFNSPLSRGDFCGMLSCLITYEFPLLSVIIILSVRSCPNCHAWMSRAFEGRQVTGKRLVTRWQTVYDVIYNSRFHVSGYIARTVSYEATEVSYLDNFICKKCGHRWAKKGTYDERT